MINAIFNILVSLMIVNLAITLAVRSDGKFTSFSYGILSLAYIFYAGQQIIMLFN